MASFAEDSAWDVLGLADPSKPLCLEVQQPMARYLADGSKTVETRRYELPSWATNVEVAVLETKDEPGLSTLGEAPDQGAGLLVGFRAAKACEIPKGSYLGRPPLVSADFWTSDHLSERSRSVDPFSGTIARGTLMLKRRRTLFPLGWARAAGPWPRGAPSCRGK